MSRYSVLAIFSNHTNNLVKYNTSINNFRYIRDNVNGIVMIDSSDERYAHELKRFLENDTKINDYILIPNDNQFDVGKWVHALQHSKINYSHYDYVLFINDSIMISHSITPFFTHLQLYTKNLNVYAYNDSTQVTYHYQSYLFFLHSTIIPKWIQHYQSRKHQINSLESVVTNIELELHNLDPQRDSYLKLGNYTNIGKNIYWENDKLYRKLVTKNILCLIKVKRIYDYHREFRFRLHTLVPGDFDADFYRNIYPDMATLNDECCAQHYLNCGQHEGRRYKDYTFCMLPEFYHMALNQHNLLPFCDVPRDFDVYYYKKFNTDIAPVSIEDSVRHFVEHGIYEDRIYKPMGYPMINRFYHEILHDLKLIPNDQPCDDLFYIHHYCAVNQFEKRDIANAFLDYYQNKKFGNRQLLTGYKVPNDFSPEFYKHFNKSLCHLSDDDLRKHYIETGIYMNLQYQCPKDFDCNFYRKVYDDVINLKDDQCKKHFVEKGFDEGRLYRFPHDFSPEIYKTIHPDLSSLTAKQALDHFVEHGIKEKRVYNIPYDFDPQTYRFLYKDTRDIEDDEELKRHYLNVGVRQRRIYKTSSPVIPSIPGQTFSSRNEIIIPREVNPNSVSAPAFLPNQIFHNAPISQVQHTPIKIEPLKELQKDDIVPLDDKNLPIDFNYKIYRSLYKDLININDKEFLENHFTNFGRIEGRIYKLPKSFDWKQYIRLNPELGIQTENEANAHFLKIGFRENYRY